MMIKPRLNKVLQSFFEQLKSGLSLARAWLEPFVRSLPSSHKVPCMIPGFANIQIFEVQPSFAPLEANSAFHPANVGTVNEYQHLLGANL